MNPELRSQQNGGGSLKIGKKIGVGVGMFRLVWVSLKMLGHLNDNFPPKKDDGPSNFGRFPKICTAKNMI